MPWVMKTTVRRSSAGRSCRQMRRSLVLEDEPGLGVERGERLVHQEDLGLVDDQPGEGDALAHAAGELVGIAVLGALEVDELDDPRHPRRALAAVEAAAGGAVEEAELDVADAPSATGRARSPGT